MSYRLHGNNRLARVKKETSFHKLKPEVRSRFNHICSRKNYRNNNACRSKTADFKRGDLKYFISLMQHKSLNSERQSTEHEHRLISYCTNERRIMNRKRQNSKNIVFR